MNLDFRKVARYAVNILAVAYGVLTLPAFGAVLPAEWLPEVAVIAGGINAVLSLLRQFDAGENLLTK